MIVWVVIKDCGYDGYSYPYGVFSTEEKALFWLVQNYGEYALTNEYWLVHEFDVEGLK